MRKRLSVAVAAMILACAISPAAVWAVEPPTTETTVTNEESAENDIETPDLDEQDEQDDQDDQDEQDDQNDQGEQNDQDEQDDQDEQNDQDEQYEQYEQYEQGEQDMLYAPAVTSLAQAMTANDLQDKINQIDHLKGGTLTLVSSQTISGGLFFAGDSNAPADQRPTFIIDAKNQYDLTLNEKGISATNCNVIIKDCPNLTINASKNPGDPAAIAACYFGHATLTLDNCRNVTITNDQEEGQGGSGICVYDEGSLYFQNNTNVTISGYMADRCSGIYMDRGDQNYDVIRGSINVVNNSSLTATKCFHNGITANPYDINVTGNSVLTVKNNGDSRKPYQHEGGIGCYFSTLTISDHSSVISEDNGVFYGVYTHNLKVDGTSNIQALNNGMYGVVISGEGILSSGAKLIAEGNCDYGGAGVMTEKYDPDDEAYWGRLTVENGATLSSCGNYYPGFINEYMFTVSPNAHVYLNENLTTGLDNYPGATTTVEEKADFTITGNHGYGIKNGNSKEEKFIGKPAILVLKSGLIAKNNKTAGIPGYSEVPPLQDLGGGIYNENGHVTLYNTTKVYNNHAEVAGDDLYNAPTTGNYFTITNKAPGAKWCLLDIDQKIIDDWYKDEAGTDKRWSEDNAINNTDIELSPGAALKAAHGKVAPTPSPSPTPEATATPVPTNEPSPVPSASPVPSTPMPSAVPTAAPTAAPVQPTTAPVAPVTRVDATATPAPTDAPTQQPTTAPAATAQPTTTATIPQTGDTAPLALFGGLTISSAAAFYFLRKRRKSE